MNPITVELLAVALFDSDGNKYDSWRNADNETRAASREKAKNLIDWLNVAGVTLHAKTSKAKTSLRTIITVPAHLAYDPGVDID